MTRGEEQGSILLGQMKELELRQRTRVPRTHNGNRMAQTRRVLRWSRGGVAATSRRGHGYGVTVTGGTHEGPSEGSKELPAATCGDGPTPCDESGTSLAVTGRPQKDTIATVLKPNGSSAPTDGRWGTLSHISHAPDSPSAHNRLHTYSHTRSQPSPVRNSSSQDALPPRHEEPSMDPDPASRGREHDDEPDDSAALRQLLELAKNVCVPSELSPPYQTVTKLDLSGVGLSELPANLPQAFPNLSILFLSHNRFAEMPAVIGQCPALRTVAFRSNHMTSIHPDALQPQLRWLILTDNAISHIPETIARCVHLQKLMLAGNRLTSMPEAAMVPHCRALELVRLASNRLAQPPTRLLRDLPNLKWIALGDNPFLQDTYQARAAEQGGGDVWWPEGMAWIHGLEWSSTGDDKDQDILGRGAGGVTRKLYWPSRQTHVAVKSFEPTTTTGLSTTQSSSSSSCAGQDQEMAARQSRTLRRMTSDGRPEHEAILFCAASAATAHLDPPAVVQVLGLTRRDDDNDSVMVVMEYLHHFVALAQPPSMDTCTRDVYTDSGWSVTLSQASSLVTRWLDALVALHAAGICHGDLYGHNVLVRKDAVDDRIVPSRLSDFGASFFYDAKSEWGRCLQICELRAFGVLVQEVLRELVADPCGQEPTASDSELRQLLEQLANKCLVEYVKDEEWEDYTFGAIAIWWKQQQLRGIAKRLHDDLFP